MKKTSGTYTTKLDYEGGDPIARAIRDGRPYVRLLPPETAKVIRELHGVELKDGETITIPITFDLD